MDLRFITQVGVGYLPCCRAGVSVLRPTFSVFFFPFPRLHVETWRMGGADGITRKKKGWNAFDQTCLGNKTPLEREQQKEKKNGSRRRGYAPRGLVACTYPTLDLKSGRTTR